MVLSTSARPKAACLLLGAMLLLCFVALVAACGQKDRIEDRTGFDGAWKNVSTNNRIIISKSGDGYSVRYLDGTPGTFSASVSPSNPYLLLVNKPAIHREGGKIMYWLGVDVEDYLSDDNGSVWRRTLIIGQ